jgi:hypothetical protein
VIRGWAKVAPDTRSLNGRKQRPVCADSITLIEMPEHNSISVCVCIEQDRLLQVGERINGRFGHAYMNGYNWDVLISFYVQRVDPALMLEVQTDPEAGLFSAYIDGFNPTNLAKMKRLKSHVRTPLADESTHMRFIEQHVHEIEWI